MKKKVIKFLIGVIFVLAINSCGEDVDTLLEPDQATIVIGIDLLSSESVVPEMKTMDLTIIQIYNNGTKEPMTVAEVNSRITWEVDSDDEMSAIKDLETGNAKIQGIGTARLMAIYNPDAKTGNKKLISNAINVRTIEAVMTGIEVKPADHYSVGCENSYKPSTELVVGCLMQFQAIAHFNNGLTQDITDQADWSSDDGGSGGVADLLVVYSLDNFSDYDWYSARADYVSTNNLSNKVGLALGYSVGSFKLTASYTDDNNEEFTNISDTVTVISPELYSLESHIVDKNGSICADNCDLFENISLRIEVEGTYNNGVQKDITRPNITSNPEDNAIVFGKINGDYTGVVEIKYDAPDSVTFTIEAEGIPKEIYAPIYKEKIIELRQESPAASVLGEPISRKSNTEIAFLLDADYNNHDYTVLDKETRQIKLNLDIYNDNDWSIENNSPAVLDGTLDWVEGKGHVVKTISPSVDPTNDATLIASPAAEFADDFKPISWQISINNSSTVPRSITINPSIEGEYVYGIVAGVPTPFSVMAVFDNETSKPLDTSQIDWITEPSDCKIEIVGTAKVGCIYYNETIDSYEIDTYRDLRIIARTNNFEENNISTWLDLSVTDTPLKSISILPDITSDTHIYGKDSLQFTASGTFGNGRSHVLPHDCITWSSSSGGNFGSNGLLLADDVSVDTKINIQAESVKGCPGTEVIGRTIEGDIIGETILNIDSLPEITLSAPDNVSEGTTGINLIFQNSKLISRKIYIPYKVTGSSTYGPDHDLTSGTKIIEINGTDFSQPIQIKSDDLYEGEETIIVTLLQDGLINGRLSENEEERELTITINDVDSPPTLNLSTIPASSAFEGDTVQFNFNLDSPSGRDITVDFKVNGVSSEDYKILDITTDSLTIPAGTELATLEVEILNDGFKEITEQLTLDVTADNVSNSSSSIIIDIEDIDQIKIVDPLPNPKYNISDSDQTEYLYLEQYVNADKADIEYSMYLNFNPDWITLVPGPWRIKIVVPNNIQSTEDMLVCVEFNAVQGIESDCSGFNVEIVDE